MQIDAYVRHLFRHGAQALELQSDQVARFCFETGERLTTNRVDHKQLVSMLQECMTTEQIQSLKQYGKVSFAHDAEGAAVEVVVETDRPDKWRIRLSPKTGDDAASAGGPRPPMLEPPMPRVPQVRGSIAPPPVNTAPGEPRINVFLREMVRLGASDLHLATGVEPMLRLSGAMTTLEKHGKLSGEQLRALLVEILPARNRAQFDETWDTDFAHPIPGVARFRANYFMDSNGPGAVFRQIPFELVPVERLGLPPKVLDLC